MGQFNPSDAEYDVLLKHQDLRSSLNTAGHNHRFRRRGEYIVWLEVPSHRAEAVFGEDLSDWVEYQKWLLINRLWPVRNSAGGRSWFNWQFWYETINTNKKKTKKARKLQPADEPWRALLPRPISLMMRHEKVSPGPYDSLMYCETVVFPYYKYENTTDLELGLMGITSAEG